MSKISLAFEAINNWERMGNKIRNMSFLYRQVITKCDVLKKLGINVDPRFTERFYGCNRRPAISLTQTLPQMQVYLPSLLQIPVLPQMAAYLAPVSLDSDINKSESNILTEASHVNKKSNDMSPFLADIISSIPYDTFICRNNEDVTEILNTGLSRVENFLLKISGQHYDYDDTNPLLDDREGYAYKNFDSVADIYINWLQELLKVCESYNKLETYVPFIEDKYLERRYQPGGAIYNKAMNNYYNTADLQRNEPTENKTI